MDFGSSFRCLGSTKTKGSLPCGEATFDQVQAGIEPFYDLGPPRDFEIPKT